MNKKFLLVDKLNGIEKEATYILSFQNNNEKYLIYYLDESNGNKQIFTSKLIKNTEGKNYIVDVNQNDKNRINNIIYNIVIVLPTEGNKNNNHYALIEDFKNKFNIDLSIEPVNIENQNYLINSRVAITSETLVNNCIDFYSKNLHSNQSNSDSIGVNIPIESAIQEVNNVVQNDSTIGTQTNNNSTMPNINAINQQAEGLIENRELPKVNPQMQILGSIDNNNAMKTVLNNNMNNDDLKIENVKNNEGFIINASIIIGTIALLLAVIIVTFTFIAIKKMII